MILWRFLYDMTSIPKSLNVIFGTYSKRTPRRFCTFVPSILTHLLNIDHGETISIYSIFSDVLVSFGARLISNTTITNRVLKFANSF